MNKLVSNIEYEIIKIQGRVNYIVDEVRDFIESTKPIRIKIIYFLKALYALFMVVPVYVVSFTLVGAVTFVVRALIAGFQTTVDVLQGNQFYVPTPKDFIDDMESIMDAVWGL